MRNINKEHNFDLFVLYPNFLLCHIGDQSAKFGDAEPMQLQHGGGSE